MMNQREKLIEFLSEYHSGNYDEAQRIVDHLIANGVVVLPCRCEDCECGYNWMNEGTRKIGKCAFLIGDNQYVSADGFCNLGERKGGE